MRCIRFLFLIIFSFLFFVDSARAATILQFSPSQVSVKEGEKFTITVSALPKDNKNYTVRMVVQFPGELLNVYSYAYADNWLPLRKAGYDSLDNTAGILTRTAGFPEGFDTPQVFGTITFVAKKSGVASIKVGLESMILDDQNNNVVALGSPVGVTIEATTPVVPTPIPTPVPTPISTPKPTPVSPSVLSETSSSAPSSTQETDSDSLLNDKIDEISSSSLISDILSGETVAPDRIGSIEVVPSSLSNQLSINKLTLKESSDLIAVSTLKNTSEQKVNVVLQYTIFDEQNKVVYYKQESMNLEKEDVKITEMKDLNLKQGKYNLVVTTLQENQIVDMKHKTFEVLPAEEKTNMSLFAWAISLLFLTLVTAILVKVFQRIPVHSYSKK